MCQDGFHLSGDNLRQCEKGKWTGTIPACSRHCSLPQQITHGEYNIRQFGSKVTQTSNSVDEGAEADYLCHNGYTTGSLNVPVTRICRNGLWQGPLPECCKYLVIVEHQIICYIKFLHVLQERRNIDKI